MASIISISNSILSTVVSGGGTPAPIGDFMITEDAVDFIVAENGDSLILE